MNKTELVSSVAKKTKFTKEESELAINAIIDVIEETLSVGDRVQLIGFGTFEVRDRKARVGRNPRKPDETIEIPAVKAPVFKPGKILKELVNK